MWQRIEVVQPIVVIAEYNSVFGARQAITVPYDPAFNRTKAHYSNLYWGASLSALASLGRSKGYAFVGSESLGVEGHDHHQYFADEAAVQKLFAPYFRCVATRVVNYTIGTQRNFARQIEVSLAPRAGRS